jgi:cytochrome c5
MAEPDVTKLMQPLLMRYEKAFTVNPRAYEEEYLDVLNWTVLILQRSLRNPAFNSPPPSAASSEEQVAMQRLLESIKGFTNSMQRLMAREIRDKVDKGAFSEAGAKRALDMVAQLAPLSAGAAVASQAPAQIRTRNVASGEEVYRAQCIACHGPGLAGSPKLGDVDAWAPRIRSGLSSMLRSTLQGKGAMGSQSGGDFQDFELIRAVVYMANAAGARYQEPPLPTGHPGTVTLKVRPPPPPPPPAVPYAAMNAAQKMALGERTYASNCIVCHQTNGRGAGPFPNLNRAPTLASTDSAVGVMLHGSKNGMMPGWARLSNEEIAEVINYVRFKFTTYRVEFVTPDDVRVRRM